MQISQEELQEMWDRVQRKMNYPLVETLEDAPGTKDCKMCPETRTIIIDTEAQMEVGGKDHGKEQLEECLAHELAHIEVCPRSFENQIAIKAGMLRVSPDADERLIHEQANIYADTVVTRYIARKGYDSSWFPTEMVKSGKYDPLPPARKEMAAFMGHVICRAAGKPSPFVGKAPPEVIQDAEDYLKESTQNNDNLEQQAYKCGLLSYKYVKNMDKEDKKNGTSQNQSSMTGRLGDSNNGEKPTSDDFKTMTEEEKKEAIARYLAKQGKDRESAMGRGLEASFHVPIEDFDMMKARAAQMLGFHLLKTNANKYGGMITPLYQKPWSVSDDVDALDMEASIVAGAGEVIPNVTTRQIVRKRGHGQMQEKKPQTLLLIDTSGSMQKDHAAISTFALIEAHRLEHGIVGVIGFTTNTWLNMEPGTNYSEIERKFFDNYCSGGTDYEECCKKAEKYLEKNPNLNVVMVTDLECNWEPLIKLGRKSARVGVLQFGNDYGARLLELKMPVKNVKTMDKIGDGLLELFEEQKQNER